MLTNIHFLIVVLQFCFHYADGIKCYVCNSKEEASCTDPFNVSMVLQECSAGDLGVGPAGKAVDVVEIIMQNLDSKGAEQKADLAVTADAPPGDTVCQKIIVHVGEETVTSRGCSPALVDRMHPCDAVKLSTRETVIQLRHCLTCSYDGCNAASPPGRPTPTPTLAALLCLPLLMLPAMGD